MLVPWKKNNDQPRQHIKKQRHYFANKGPSSQGYGSSRGHVWMWELYYKEGWAPRNWRFWTVELEKTLESPLTTRRSNQSILKEISPGCSLSQWCHPTISSSVTVFSSCPQSFPASGSFPMSQLFKSGGQSVGASASTSVLPMNTQDWSPLGWTGWISLQSKGLSRVFSNTTVQSINSLALSFLHSPTLTSIDDHWKNHSLD